VLNEWSAVDLSVYAVYPSRRHGVAKLRAFVDFLVEGAERGTNPVANHACYRDG